MRCSLALFLCLLASSALCAAEDKPPANPSFDYEIARTHELEPHRRSIPLAGVEPGFNQIHLEITVSPTGDVLDVHPRVEVDPPSYADRTLKFWPQLQNEVRQWKFTPFEQNGRPVTAEIEEYLDLVPPERLPAKHVAPPVIRPDSKVSIGLMRTGCFGTCPSYTVSVTTDGILFEGNSYVVATGKHKAKLDANAVRNLAKRFVAADFYSMDDKYVAGVTDNPTYELSISIDGREKKVEDYVGSWVGMPAVISELENAVDDLAETKRWLAGGAGLVSALQAEQFNFQTFDAQVLLKEAASRGEAETVRQLIAAGVPLYPLPAPKPKAPTMAVPFAHEGLLSSAGRNFETLQVLLDAGVSRNDQADKDVALADAAGSGSLDAVHALIAYGANPNADLAKLTGTNEDSGLGSVLINAAASGNPDVVREILRYHPDLEKRTYENKTAIFLAGDYRSGDKDGARVECVRLLAEAGANVNARDKNGNTPLHEIYLTDVEEELLKLGAEVNARNNDGETPIFTNVDDDSISLFIEHGADLSVRNNEGEDVAQAAKDMGPARQEALRKALEKLPQH